MIQYQQEKSISTQEFIRVLNNSTLGERRPVDDKERIQKMIDHSNLIITARENGKLIGVARSFTDFAFCTYMSDLAVDMAYQKQGIGVELIRQTKLLTLDAKLILIAAPAAEKYYPKIGMDKRDYCFTLDEIMNLRSTP